MALGQTQALEVDEPHPQLIISLYMFSNNVLELNLF